MTMARKSVKLLAGCLLVWSSSASVHAAPTVEDMLRFMPKQQGVAITTPTPQEYNGCKVELVTGGKPGSSGWLLRDARGLPVRRYFDSNGDRDVDMWSYFKDGIEVYREVDSDFNKKVDQYRWLNGAGTKCGVSTGENGKINTWRIISAEEVSQEVFQAVVTRDFERLQAMFVTEREMQALGLPAAEVNRIQQLQAAAKNKFTAALTKLAGVNEKTQWVRLEAGIPSCIPADQIGGNQDVIKYARATVLYENAGKHDFIQIGEMIQVGQAWRIIDVPAAGDDSAPAAQANPEMQKLLDELRLLDTKAPTTVAASGPNPEVVRYNLSRAGLIQQIMLKDKPEQQDLWVKQIAECLSTAAQSSPAKDTAAYDRLAQLATQVAKEKPGTDLAAFVTFREMQADYAVKMAGATGEAFTKVQTAWLERLTKFVQAYPKSEDAPEALMQLGMVSEFVNQEIQAKNAYAQLARDFPTHPMTVKARGAVRRLEAEGKPLELAGQVRGGGNYDITQQGRGKIVIVYYWASWNQQCIGDFARLKDLVDKQAKAGVGVDLVCVNLDNTPAEAESMLARAAVPGVHIMQTGGLESPLATAYGVMSLPNLFLVDSTGKVVSRTVQVGGLEDEIKKLLKK